LADGETALGLYRKLADERAGTFLLESAEHGRSWSRYSFVGVASSAMLSERNGQALWSGKVPQGVPETGDPIAALRETLNVLFTPGVNEGITNEELPPLTGGVVGYLGYDIVRRLEKLPNETEDVLGLPELAMLVATDLAVLDHKDGTLRGPNVDLLKQMCERTDKPVIASGGIATLDDLIELRALTETGVEGAIVGKALYARAFTLEEAIEVSGPQA
jgi:anthranilate/para-aminobenzoate synthase component I